MLSTTQLAAYKLIQADSVFLLSLSEANKSNFINGNLVIMSQPYIGIFVDGAIKWAHKMGFELPKQTKEERSYFESVRQGHKLLSLSCEALSAQLSKKLKNSDSHFYSIRSIREKLFGYYNVGTDLYKGEYCGNTVLGSAYSPMDLFENDRVKLWLYKLGIAGGQMSVVFGADKLPHYKLNKSDYLTYKDFHFFDNCPLKEKSELGLILFSILCGINYATVLIDNLFTDNIPQKLKIAYLQYYYLCDLVQEINQTHQTSFSLNPSLKKREFRNCLAHYGLGQYMTADDIRFDDPLMGLTFKAFDINYHDTKKALLSYLNELAAQIKKRVF